MARRGNPVSLPSMDEGFPIPRTVDGVNVAKVAGREGYNKNLGTCLDQHTDWRNSKTGARMDAPEYAKDDDY